MKLLGANEESADSASNRPQIRTSQDDAAVGYGFHQENEFPAFVPKRWPGTDDAIDVNISLFSHCVHFSILLHYPEKKKPSREGSLILFIKTRKRERWSAVEGEREGAIDEKKNY